MRRIWTKLKKQLEKRRLRRLLSSQFISEELRELFLEKYRIEVGLYSYGCFDPKRFDPNTKFGRYCSVSNTAVRFGRNHPVDKLTMHPYFYNHRLGMIEKDSVEFGQCEIGDDVWIGGYSVILPKVLKVGRGAVIAAGAIVTKDILPYTIVAGNPAKPIGTRFDEKQIEWVENSLWWEKSADELEVWLRQYPDLPLNPIIFQHSANPAKKT